MIELAAGGLCLRLDPQQGAAVRALDIRLPGQGRVPVLQPADPGDATVRGSALFPMVPFANRARGNVLDLGERRISLTPNTEEPLAIHGFGWQSAWQVTRQEADRCSLYLAAAPGWPLRFESRIEIRLAPGAAEFHLGVTNPGPEAIPAGLGWHPYLPHRPGTDLQFRSERFWLAGPDHLPTDPLRVPPELDFAAPRPVPSTWRNNCYDGWSGQAVIRQPELGYRLEMCADAPLRHLMFYAPQSGVFALEPQSHLSGRTRVAADGLVALPPGATLAACMRLRVVPLAAARPEGG